MSDDDVIIYNCVYARRTLSMSSKNVDLEQVNYSELQLTYVL